MKNNPVILLGSYQVNDIYRLIITHLIDMGYKVVDISYNHEPPPFKYRSLTTRLLVLFKRIIFRQKNAKQKLIQKEKDLYIESVNKQVSKKLDQYKSFDFSIILGGQIYHKNHLLEIKRKTKNLMVAYQSDGLTRFPKIFDCLDIFHKVYIFDPKDYKSYKNSITNLYPATNFYFDRITFNTGKSNIPYSFYFRGVHLDELSRAKSISVFAKYALQNNLNTDITIYHLNNRSFKKHNKLYPSNVKASLQAIPFSENIENEKNSWCLLDFCTPIHTGVSFRTIEAIGYQKKLITTNHWVKTYDFYHPNNIFIWDGENINSEELDSFLNSPYYDIGDLIRKKYSFTNWIRYLLNIHPYQEINLPDL